MILFFWALHEIIINFYRICPKGSFHRWKPYRYPIFKSYLYYENIPKLEMKVMLLWKCYYFGFSCRYFFSRSGSKMLVQKVRIEKWRSKFYIWPPELSPCGHFTFRSSNFLCERLPLRLAFWVQLLLLEIHNYILT